ncbi:alpha-tocopherol transfer protein isoform X1 [Lucilia sericata]|uniref:alpha-tocopherol transfer protein isoform X1 n=2 Tax=Lucilia sericata TaxID=13632 RepID=UPI0018A8177D|nr:alpha-tocopherol transfer protein isoform X1 [Lucilia sericata]
MVVKPGLEEQILALETWLKTQPQLPQNIDKLFLKRFIHSMNGDLDGAKRLLEFNFKLRNKHSEIFLKRDPLDESSQKLLQVADLIPLPGKTPDNYKLLIYRLIDHDADKFNFTDSIKVFFMMSDCRFAINDEPDDGEVPIFDMSGYSLRHLTKTVLSVLRVYMKFVQEAHPVRIRQIHVLNSPSYLDKVLTVIKPFMKSEVFKLIHFHLPNADTPYEYFPREMLPLEYGGKAGSLKELKAFWMQKLEEKRDYLMDPSRWQMDKSKKPLKSTEKSAKSPDLTQSLKTLEID